MDHNMNIFGEKGLPKGLKTHKLRPIDLENPSLSPPPL